MHFVYTVIVMHVDGMTVELFIISCSNLHICLPIILSYLSLHDTYNTCVVV